MEIIHEGFWHDKSESTITLSMPVCCNYHNPVLVDKLRQIMTIVSEHHVQIGDYHTVNRYFKYTLTPLPLESVDYCGYSYCRLCPLAQNGSKEITINTGNHQLIFPEGYIHYIEQHGVAPSHQFIQIVTQLDLSSLTYPETPITLLRLIAISNITGGMAGLIYTS